jgi:hypothetical protein
MPRQRARAATSFNVDLRGGGIASGASPRLNINAQVGSYQWHTGQGRSGTGQGLPDKAAIAQWWKASGLKTGDATVRKQIGELAGLVQTIGQDGQSLKISQFSRSSSSSSSWSYPEPWYGITILVVWLALYIGGIFAFFRIRKKHRPAVAPAGQSASQPQPEEAVG